MKKFKHIAINSVLFVIIIVGLLFVFNKPIQTQMLTFSSNSVMKDVQVSNIEDEVQVAQVAAAFEQNEQAEATFNFEAVEPISLTNTVSSTLTLPTMRSNVPVIGQIAVPSVNIHLPIGKGLSEAVLSTGAGTMKEDQQLGEGNYALAGHNLEGTDVLFSPLHRAQIGDQIYITDLQHIYTYEITLAEVIEPTDVYVLDDIEHERLLTLITCAFDGQDRLHIKAAFIEKTPLQDATDVMREAFQF